MTAISKTIKLEQEKIENDLEENIENKPETVKTSEQSDISLSEDKLAKLKEKLAKKDKEKKMSKSDKSIEIGVIGSGQCGSRIAQAFYSQGYDAVIINTALQDLKNINIPESNKLLLNYGLGGTAKDIAMGEAAAETYKEQILELVEKQLSNSQVLILAASLGGGSGSGSLSVLIDCLSSLEKPMVVITVLPMNSEDAQSKQNSLTTLSKLTKLAQSKKISNLIVVDNAKIETIYKDINPMEFFTKANDALVKPLVDFNHYSSVDTVMKPLDSTEFARLFLDSEALSVYGEIVVKNYTDETALAEAVHLSLSDNLLASGFDLSHSKYVGCMFLANKNVWSKMSASAVNYAVALMQESGGTPKATYQGSYITENPNDEVRIISMFSGVSLPEARINQLKAEAKELSQIVQQKEEARNLSLNLDTGKDEVVSKAQEIKNKIAAKGSAFGKFTTGVIDRREKK